MLLTPQTITRVAPTPNSELRAWTEDMIQLPGEEVAIDPALIDSAWEKAKAASGFEGPWDPHRMFTFVMRNQAFMDPQTGQRVWSGTNALPALDLVTGTVSYKEFIYILLKPDEMTPEVIERCLVYEMLGGLFNRKMLVDPSIPPMPGIKQMMLQQQMNKAFPGFNGHPVPESQGGPPRQGVPDRTRPSRQTRQDLQATDPEPYSVRSELKA